MHSLALVMGEAPTDRPHYGPRGAWPSSRRRRCAIGWRAGRAPNRETHRRPERIVLGWFFGRSLGRIAIGVPEYHQVALAPAEAGARRLTPDDTGSISMFHHIRITILRIST